jgi:iron complex transport system substrate-binding protein
MPLRNLVTAACLLWLASAANAAPPQRVMSLNLCTDQMLLNLLPSERIASVTYLSRDRHQSYLSPEAWHVAGNRGMAEEVVRDHPDLVLAGEYTSRGVQQLVERAGIPVLVLPPANDFRQIRDQTRQVGRLLGVEARAEQLLQKMDATLAELAATTPKRPISVVAWEGGSSVYGQGTLHDAIFSAAGAVNIGASPGLRTTRFDTEQLLMAHPDLLAFGDATIEAPSLQESPLELPVVKRLYAGRQIVYPELLYSCGLPQSADAAVQVRQIMLSALQSATSQ